VDEVFRQFVLIALVAGAVLDAFYHLRLPAVVGLLVSGVLLGPQVTWPTTSSPPGTASTAGT
jgi:Kef-type K+ transport system membrane component KefB